MARESQGNTVGLGFGRANQLSLYFCSLRRDWGPPTHQLFLAITAAGLAPSLLNITCQCHLKRSRNRTGTRLWGKGYNFAFSWSSSVFLSMSRSNVLLRWEFKTLLKQRTSRFDFHRSIYPTKHPVQRIIVVTFTGPKSLRETLSNNSTIKHALS